MLRAREYGQHKRRMTLQTTKKHNLLLFLLLVGLPCTALANAGTPLMWGCTAHLALGNIFIGVLEGTLLRWRIHDKGYHPIAVMILANYFSAICGGFLTYGSPLLVWWTSHWTLPNLRTNCILLIMLLWLATILLEWPFVWFAMGKELHHWGKALKCSLLLQSISYILLVGWYMLCGNHSLLTCKVVSPEAIGIPENVCIYFISQNNESVYKLHPVNGTPVKIANLPRKLRKDEVAEGYEAFLVFVADEEEPTKANLMERTYTRRAFGRADLIPILSHFAVTDKVLQTPFGKDKSRKYGDCNMFVGRPFGNAIASNHRFRLEHYAEFGITLLKRRDKNSPSRYNSSSETDVNGFRWADWEDERGLLGLGSPVGMWWIRNIIQFENDTILLEFPNQQICLFDYRTNRIAFLARGCGATAAIE